MVIRTFYQDRYNPQKTWEVVKMEGAYYLRQYICGHKWARGLRCAKSYIREIGIFEFEKINFCPRKKPPKNTRIF